MFLASAVAIAFLSLVPTAADDDRVVRLRALPPDELAPATPTIDRLEDGDLVTVRVTGGVALARGQVRQCVLIVDGYRACVNHFPVQFGDRGDATFLYELDDPGRCDGTMACVLVVDDVGGERAAYAFTVFGTSAPPAPDIDISPPGPYEPGAEVRVLVSALQPGTIVKTAFCEPACGTTTSTAADETGTVVSSVRLRERCTDCRIVIVSGTTSSSIDVSFVAPPSTAYDVPRLVAGLGFAAVLLLTAQRIITSVDWRPPSEAQTPELDVPVTD